MFLRYAKWMKLLSNNIFVSCVWLTQSIFMMPRPVLGSTQSPLQWVLTFFPSKKWLWCKVDHSPISSAKVKNRSYNSSPPTCLNGMDRNKSPCVCVCVVCACAHVHVPKSNIPAPSMECVQIFVASPQIYCGITSNLCIFFNKHLVIITVTFTPKFHSSSHNNIFTKYST